MAKGIRKIQTSFVLCLLLCTAFSGCFGEESEEVPEPELSVFEDSDVTSLPRGQPFSLEVKSNVEFTIQRPAGTFFIDEFGVFRDAMNMTFEPSVESVEFMVLDTEQTSLEFIIMAGDIIENKTFDLVESDELMLVDGRRAYETIDMLTSQHNNRWCASASVHEGGSAYEAAAEAMAVEMWEMGFDHVEVTRYDDDPDQLNVVGYNWGGSTVSLEMAQALAQMEFDHTVVAGLWACEEEGLLGSAAYVNHLPENVSVRAYMNFDMVSLNYPIVPLSEPLVGPGGEIFSATKYDWTISIAGANEENMNRMYDWVGTTIDEDLAYEPTEANPITWQISESCASDHCSFFSAGYPTFNFFSPGGDISFWQEWHSPSDTLEFMTAKAGGQEGMESGFNSLVWSSLDLFVRVDNAENFHGTWKE